MRIDGERIAQSIRDELRTKIQKLAEQKIVPGLAIITLGPEESWEIYVKRKIKVAKDLGIKAVLINLEDANEDKLIRTVRDVDLDPAYHGIIVQRPIPFNFNRERVVNSISPEKDVDGFRADSKFEVPVWLAVKRILSIVNGQWSIVNSNIVVVGKGETAGAPIIHGLKNLGVEPLIIDSQTKNRDEILKNADIIISCVGKPNIIRANNIKQGVTLIGVGTHGEDGELRGDYNQKEIEKIAIAYTPTPGGVGPVNLSYLFKNLVQAAKLTIK
jgi:methylenetetrahydrofolate dehydrogenase (NADP+)/methenyltetrahydrofolate cyclohydrolase